MIGVNSPRRPKRYAKPVMIVSSLGHIEALLAKHQPTRSLSLLAPWQTIIFDADALPRDHLILAFNDVTAPGVGHIVPDESIVRSILEFGRACDPRDPVLIHCWMGVSRSPAAAYIIACDRAPGEERRLAAELRRRSPTATPNPLIVALADSLLERQGRMVAAIESIGRGCDFDGEPAPFCLPLIWGADETECV